MKGVCDWRFSTSDPRRPRSGGAGNCPEFPLPVTRHPSGVFAKECHPSHAEPARGFTIIELLVATAVTALIAGLMIMVISNSMSAWRRSFDSLQTNAQARIALDRLAEDLSSLIMKRDGRAWLLATVQPDQSASGDAGGTLGRWTSSGGDVLKPGWNSPGAAASSLQLAPDSGAIEDCRFGMAGVWLRFITGVPDSNKPSGIHQTSAPRAVSYQIVRHRLSGYSGGSAARYSLFRAEVRPFHDTAASQAVSTFVVGYDLNDASYAAATSNNLGDSGNIRRPRRDILLANSIVDFGIRFYARDPATGNLVLVFPISNNNRGFAATTNTRLSPGGAGFDYAGEMTYGFPDVAEVFMRVLPEDGARRIEALESGELSGLDWWTIVTAGSETFSRRIVINSRPL